MVRDVGIGRLSDAVRIDDGARPWPEHLAQGGAPFRQLPVAQQHERRRVAPAKIEAEIEPLIALHAHDRGVGVGRQDDAPWSR